MYNVIIVDDESVALTGLKNFIDWESYGFNIVAQCTNGNDAFELCRKLEPELLITDIRMNNGDGLSLISNIRTSDLQTEIIILTGFEDFHVAKTAIEQKVHQILLKPLEMESFTNSLLSVRKKIDTLKMNMQIMKTYINYNNSRFLHRLLNEPELDNEKFENICNKYKVTLPNGNYLIALLHIDKAEPLNFENLQFALVDILNSITLTDKHFVIANALSSKNVPLLIFENRDSGIDGILHLLNEIRNEFKKLTQNTLTIGISLFFNKITSISHAFTQARNALGSMSHFGNDCIIDYSHISIQNADRIPPFTQKEIYSLCNTIKKFDKEGALAFINNYFNKLSSINNVEIDDVRTNILELSIFVLKECVQNSVALADIMGRTPTPAGELQQFEPISDIQDWITELITVLTEHSEIVMSEAYSAIVQNAIIYTMTYYSEPLTAAFVAKQLYVSTNHFMRIFKKETGKTYGQYLTEYRIKIAKILLKSNEYKIYEVGQMVGYPNTKYFNRIFKKLTGHIPSHYMEVEE